MLELHRIKISEVGDVTVVHFQDRKIIDDGSIHEMGEELFALVEQDGRKKILLNFSDVEFLSSGALNKLILLEQRMKAQGGKLKLCCLRPEIQEIFVITRLNNLFDIRDDQADAVEGF